jgi:hypothetical protein
MEKSASISSKFDRHSLKRSATSYCYSYHSPRVEKWDLRKSLIIWRTHQELNLKPSDKQTTLVIATHNARVAANAPRMVEWVDRQISFIIPLLFCALHSAECA